MASRLNWTMRGEVSESKRGENGERGPREIQEPKDNRIRGWGKGRPALGQQRFRIGSKCRES